MSKFDRLKKCRVAVDLGAGSGRLVIGNINNGKLSLNEFTRFATPLLKDTPGGLLCWDIDTIEANIRGGLIQCQSHTPAASIGIDSWGVDYVLLNAGMQRVGQVVCYRDKRTDGMMERVSARVQKSAVYRRTGIQFQPFNTLYQLAACSEQTPEWLQSARHLAMIPDYLNYRLCGIISNEYTNATTTQMLDVSGAWDPELLRAAGLQSNLMLPPVPAGTVLGPMQSGQPGLQVIAPATHDTASAVAAVPLQSESEAYISSGTWSLMGIERKMPILTREAFQMNFTNEGGVEGRFRVLKNIMGMWPLQCLCRERHIAEIANLVSAAADAAGWRSIVHLDDIAFLNPESLTETIRQYCASTGQPAPRTDAEFARCIFDSLALSYRLVKEQLELISGCTLTRLRIVGGGAKNRLLNQLCADACQVSVSAGSIEASALGNICVQMIASGELEDLDQARALILFSFPTEEYIPKAGVPESVWHRFGSLLTFKYPAREKAGIVI